MPDYFAQFNEDRRLVTLLGDRSEGFYIDVGAWHPATDSVTKHFYDRGWHGINIEPMREYFEMLVKDRPRDVNLQVALGDVGGGLLKRMFRVSTTAGAEVAGSGLATFDADNALNAVTRAGFALDPLDVQVYTLAEVCEEYVPPGLPIDFLKIDVEGWEEQVIRGADWERWRPKVLCIEATRPSSDIPAWEWEPLLLEAGYTFLEFDSLNRWYMDER